MKANAASYKPALRWNNLTQFYDRVMAMTMREKHIRTLLLEPIRHEQPQYVLDVGCGTGTQALLLHKYFPQASIFGLDGDETALRIANEKQAVEGGPIVFERGLSTAIPHPDASMDIITCSLLFHHLSDMDKRQSIAEIHRVLTVEGTLMLLDWGKPANKVMRLLFYGLQLFDGFETTKANVQGRIPSLLFEGGFRQITETAQVNTLFGTLVIYHVKL